MNLDPLAGLAPARQFGPWAPDLDPAERLARLRSLRAIVRLLTGPRGAALVDLLQAAETDPAALVPAADTLDALAPVDLRRILASYAGLTRPVAPARRSGPGVRAYPRPTIRVRPRPPVMTTSLWSQPRSRTGTVRRR